MKISFREFEKTIIGDWSFGKELLETYIEQIEDYLIDLKIYANQIPKTNELRFSNHKIKASFKLFLLQDLIELQEQMMNCLEKKATANFQKLVRTMSEFCLELIKELRKRIEQNNLT